MSDIPEPTLREMKRAFADGARLGIIAFAHTITGASQADEKLARKLDEMLTREVLAGLWRLREQVYAEDKPQQPKEFH